MSLHEILHLPPETDLCQLPSGAPPPGSQSNFENPSPSQHALTIGLSVSTTALATLFVAGRLHTNIKKLGWGDGLVLLALCINISEAGSMLAFLKYFRHSWDVRFCWINAQFLQLNYAWEVLNNVGLFLAKTATLLLLYQLFNFTTYMRRLVRLGLAINFAVYAAGLVIVSYAAAPHAGQSWHDSLLEQVAVPPVFPLQWGVTQGSLGLMLDIYIFILPLPVVCRLTMPTRRRVQMFAVFGTALLAVVASAMSLYYRVMALTNVDRTWNSSAIMNCILVESNVAVIIACAPMFANIVRVYILDSKVIQSLRSSLGVASSGDSAAKMNPNQPRTGRGNHPQKHEQDKWYYGPDEAWLLKSGVSVSHAPAGSLPSNYHSDSVNVTKTVDIERASKAPSEESTKGLVSTLR